MGLKTTLFNSLIINTIALFLGSYWALQEGTWGGWWDWDPSEVFGLLFFIIPLTISHSLLVNKNLFKIIIKLTTSTFIILLTYFLIQLNFDLVSHNFGTKFFYFFNNNLFLLEFIIFFISVYFLSNLYLMYIINNLYTIQYDKPLNIYSYNTYFSISFIYTLLTILILFSFLPLFNYFIWYDITTNYYDLVTYFNVTIIYFIIIILGLFRFKQLFNYFILLIIGVSYLFPFYFLYFFKWSSSHINLIHNLILLFVIINITTHFMDITYFGINSEISSIILNNTVLNNQGTYFNCDNFFIDSLNVYTDINNMFFFDWNIFYMTNSVTNHPSLLLFNENSVFNFYTILHNWLISYSFIDINYLSILYNVFIVILLFVLFVYKIQPLITITY